MAIHAAREYGARVTGVTLSVEQAAFARKRIAEEGLTDRIEIRVQDYRDVRDGPYDAISSIGMAEHVGSVRYREYADDLYALLKPGGRLLNHQIARRPEKDESAYHVDEFIDAYVFPDGELAPVGRTVATLEEAGFEARDVESLREHYALTLRRWVANLEKGWPRAVKMTSPGRARVWRLYMAASALSFEHNKIGVNQILAVRPAEGGAPACRCAPATGRPTRPAADLGDVRDRLSRETYVTGRLRRRTRPATSGDVRDPVIPGHGRGPVPATAGTGPLPCAVPFRTTPS